MKSAETCSCSLCNKLYTYLYHHTVVLDKYYHDTNGDDAPQDSVGNFEVFLLQLWFPQITLTFQHLCMS